jgi:hypothetical protein
MQIQVGRMPYTVLEQHSVRSSVENEGFRPLSEHNSGSLPHESNDAGLPFREALSAQHLQLFG